MPNERARVRRVVVVGAGLAGARTAEHVRRLGYDGELIMLSAEAHRPYDRPPLSKEVLRGERDDTELPLDLDGRAIQLRLNVTATSLDIANRTLSVRVGPTDGSTDGSTEQLPFDKLIIATGSVPKRLPGAGRQYTLRTIEDARTLRAELVAGKRVVLVGASWIGAEVATVALAAGCAVTCLEYGPAPNAQALGNEVGARLASWWSDIDLRLNTTVGQVADAAVVLGDGTAIEADIVVTGVGVRPETDWLNDSGLQIDRGVVVDEWLRAAPDVVAVGDVAAWWSRRYATRMRVEHWDDAVSAAGVAAASVLRDADSDHPDLGAPSHDPVPYFWSDQFGHKVQYLGHHDARTAPIWREPTAGKGWSAAWLDATGRLTALLAVDRPGELARARKALMGDTFPDPMRLADASIALADA